MFSCLTCNTTRLTCRHSQRLTYTRQSQRSFLCGDIALETGKMAHKFKRPNAFRMLYSPVSQESRMCACPAAVPAMDGTIRSASRPGSIDAMQNLYIHRNYGAKEAHNIGMTRRHPTLLTRFSFCISRMPCCASGRAGGLRRDPLRARPDRGRLEEARANCRAAPGLRRGLRGLT